MAGCDGVVPVSLLPAPPALPRPVLLFLSSGVLTCRALSSEVTERRVKERWDECRAWGMGAGGQVQARAWRPHPSCPTRKQVLGTKVDAERDGVKVPTTLAEYCVKSKAPAPDEGSDLFYDDYYEDGEAEGEADSCFGDDEDDSGTEES
ncbi:hypothetical protein P7K49_032679 [Saguinus oedipus]|uniref:Uncharacterized protein n=1 Tax=Saguinus oedipus TaxID=9490 RepID=A0ABQ9TPS2_SAGOE|nr:hypothetical protein P7K49_032679 [Saguinus oedipus]